MFTDLDMVLVTVLDQQQFVTAEGEVNTAELSASNQPTNQPTVLPGIFFQWKGKF